MDEVEYVEEVVLRPVPAPRTSDYNPHRARELVRGSLALGLLALLGLVLLLLLQSVLAGWRTWEEVQGLATAVLGPLIGLTGTMLGFYFGQKDR